MIVLVAMRTIEVRGAIDESFERQLIACLEVLAEKREAKIDLTDCRSICPMAIAHILSFQRRQALRGADVTIVGAGTEIKEAFDRLTAMLPISVDSRFVFGNKWRIDAPDEWKPEKAGNKKEHDEQDEESHHSTSFLL